MGESIGLRNLVKEGRVKLAIRDLRGLMRDLLERILFSRLKHENTGLESVSIVQIMTQIMNNYTSTEVQKCWKYQRAVSKP